ncbi:MAG TPA: hypothetical protein VMN03_12740 [Burkholderiales bacterium]|nr:hypothetical protein [Burkholderiales bacterium]
MAAEAQGDLIEARTHETLLAPDADMVKMRRLIADAHCRPRIPVAPHALEFPF